MNNREARIVVRLGDRVADPSFLKQSGFINLIRWFRAMRWPNASVLEHRRPRPRPESL